MILTSAPHPALRLVLLVLRGALARAMCHARARTVASAFARAFARAFAPALLLAACARPPAPAPVPAPAPPPAAATAAPSAPAAPAPAPAPGDTMISYRVPPFRPDPLVVWGAAPPGIPHAPRVRTYDLRHQSTRVRFDWTRQAVVGSTTLTLAALGRALDTVRLDAVGMRIGQVRSAAGAPLRYAYDDSTLAIALPTRLASGAVTTLTVDYEAVRPAKGAYFIPRRRVVWTQGETEDTRYWVPTYDYPNDKTTWEFFIRTDSGEVALSNGRLAGSRPVPGGIEWHWMQEKPAATYLMTAVTGNFAVLQDRWRDVPVGYWTYPDSIQAAWRGFGKTPRMVALFSERTGVKYPWAKYDQVTAPDYIFGGMENVSATTQADDGILHPAWAEPQANAEGLVAHELGHQWYGDLLTTADWANIWLNEGFATFMAQLWAEQGQSEAEGALARSQAQRQAIAADLRARRPLVYDVWQTNPLELFLSGHIYPKGASVLQMLRRQLGDSLFWRAMNVYTTRNAYRSVRSADLQQAFERATGRDLSAFFRQWVYGAGFPAIRVAYAYDSAAGTVTLRAREVQPTDSLTGYFDADVVVEVRTDGGAVRDTVALRGGGGTVVMPVGGPPRSIRWDEGGWLLGVVDFPRPTAMLAVQLAKEDDVLGRMEAVTLLGARTAEPMARRALGDAVRRDAFYAVRTSAAAALRAAAPDSAAGAALLEASRDADPRVRQAAASALGAFPGAAVLARLRALATGDSSRYVRGAALEAYARQDGAGAIALAAPLLDSTSWLDLARTNAVRALAVVRSPAALALLRRATRADVGRRTRVEAIAALVANASGREAELAGEMAALLGDDDLFVRAAAARALGELRQPASRAPLAARRAAEPESRVVNAIDAALAALPAS